MNPKTDCPSPEDILKALAEKNPSETLEHIHTCIYCQQKPELQTALDVWQLLDVLPEISASQSFEARLHSRLEKEQRSQWRWLQLDHWFDFLHIPAFVALVALLFWQPLPLPATQAHHWQRPKESQKIQTAFPVKTEKALGLIQKIYHQRSNKG